MPERAQAAVAGTARRGADRLPRAARARRCGDVAVPTVDHLDGRAPVSRARRARARREADGRRRSRRPTRCSRWPRRPARCWPSATPSASIPAIQRGAADPADAALHRSAPAQRLSRAQPRHRRRLRRDDSRPRYHSGRGSDRGRGRRGRRRAGADAEDRHRQRADEVRVRAASPTSRPAASAATRCARCASSSRTCTSRSTTRRRSSRSGVSRPRPGERPAIEGGPVEVAARRAAQARARRISWTRFATGRAAARDRRRRPPRAGARRRASARGRSTNRRRSSRSCSRHHAFIAELERRKELARIGDAGQPRSRDRRGHRSRLQVAWRRARPAVREADRLHRCRSRRISSARCRASVWRSASRQLDELAHEIEELTTPPMPRGFMDALKLMPLVSRLTDLMPKTVKDAPCQEVVKMDGGLDELPMLKTWPEDGGPFITLPLVITRDPETGMRNIGTYRMQVYDRRTTGMHWQRHKGGAQHHRVAERLGKRLEVAVALGADPVLHYCGDRADAGRARRADARRRARQASRRAGEVPHGRSRGAGATRRSFSKATSSRASAGAKGRSAITPACIRSPTTFRCSTCTCITMRKQPGLRHDGRRHSADGGLLPRQGERADLPAADPQDAARDRGHALSGGRHLSQHRARLDRQAVSRATRARS